MGTTFSTSDSLQPRGFSEHGSGRFHRTKNCNGAPRWPTVFPTFELWRLALSTEVQLEELRPREFPAEGRVLRDQERSRDEGQ